MIDIGAQLLQKDYLKSQIEGRKAASEKASFLENLGYLGSGIGGVAGMATGLGPIAIGLGAGLGSFGAGKIGASQYKDPITKFAVSETEHGLEKAEDKILSQALSTGMTVGGAAYGIQQAQPALAAKLNFGVNPGTNYLASAMNYSPFASGRFAGVLPKVGLAGLLALYLANQRRKK